jgi:uncharacterized membrane protein
MLWAFLPYHIPLLGIILALPLVFFLTGYTTIALFFYRNPPLLSMRILLSVAVSIVLDIVGGLALNLLPQGLQTTTWALLLGSITSINALITIYLRKKTHRGYIFHFPKLTISKVGGSIFLASVAITIIAVFYAIQGVNQQPHPGFSEFWLLPASQTNSTCMISIGVQSFETSTITYRITLSMNGTLIHNWTPVSLHVQGRWVQSVPVRIPTNVHEEEIEANLYRLDQPQSIYRNVHVTLYPQGNGGSKGCSTIPVST